MAIRENRGPDKGEAYGIAAITQALEGVDLPASKDDLLQRAGNTKIQYRKGRPVSLKQILQDVDQEEFASMANVVSAVKDALHEEGLTGEEEQRRRAA